MKKRLFFSLLFSIALLAPAFAQAQTACNGSYSSTLGGVEYTVNLMRGTDDTLTTSTVLGGTLSSTNLNVALQGFVGINNTCFLTAWINGSSAYASMMLVGKLTEASANGKTVGTFSFDGGSSTSGLVGAIVLPLAKTSDSPAFAPFSAPLASTSYAGVHTTSYGGSPAVLTLAQVNSTSVTDTVMRGTKLLGKLDVLNGISLYVRGFVDANNDAYLTAWFGSAILVGKLNFESGSTTQTKLNFSKGYIGADPVQNIDFKNVSVANATTAPTANFSGTYSGYFAGSTGTITLSQTGTTLTGSGSHITGDTHATFTDTITGTVSGNTASVNWSTNDACITSAGTLTLNGNTVVIITQKTGTLSPCALPGMPGGSLEGILGTINK